MSWRLSIVDSLGIDTMPSFDLPARGGTVGFFRDSAEVDRYIGGIFEVAAGHPDVARGLEASDISLRLLCSEPECELNLSLTAPMKITFGPTDMAPDVTLLLPADALDGFFRGEYSLLEGLARGEVRARGPISRILKILPLTDPLVPLYHELIADKDAESRVKRIGISS